MAGAQKGKFPFQADSRVLVFGNYFCMENPLEKSNVRLTCGVYWSMLTGSAGNDAAHTWMVVAEVVAWHWAT